MSRKKKKINHELNKCSALTSQPLSRRKLRFSNSQTLRVTLGSTEQNLNSFAWSSSQVIST